MNKSVYDRNIKTLSSKLDVYDEILSRQRYIAGDVRMPILLLADRTDHGRFHRRSR